MYALRDLNVKAKSRSLRRLNIQETNSERKKNHLLKGRKRGKKGSRSANLMAGSQKFFSWIYSKNIFECLVYANHCSRCKQYIYIKKVLIFLELTFQVTRYRKYICVCVCFIMPRYGKC